MTRSDKRLEIEKSLKERRLFGHDHLIEFVLQELEREGITWDQEDEPSVPLVVTLDEDIAKLSTGEQLHCFRLIQEAYDLVGAGCRNKQRKVHFREAVRCHNLVPLLKASLVNVQRLTPICRDAALERVIRFIDDYKIG